MGGGLWQKHVTFAEVPLMRKLRMYICRAAEHKVRMCHGMSSFPVGMSESSGLPRRGESINRLCRALTDPIQRRDFLLSEDAFCLRMGLDKMTRQAVRDRDYLRLIDLGGHVAQLDKLAALSGLTTLQAIEKRTGISAASVFGQGWGAES